MRDEIRERLLKLNREFYEQFAGAFSATRRRLQPGVLRILPSLPIQSNLLELGCGNGEFYQELARRGHAGSYTGLDFSPGLLEIASSQTSSWLGQVASTRPPVFLQADLASPSWPEVLPKDLPSYDLILAFAVLHHLPDHHLRRQVLQAARQVMLPKAWLVHSEWQFLESPRLRRRIQPWSLAGLDDADVEPGDYLLDWRSEGRGLRYVHHFDCSELALLADESGFNILETFYSDGEGGRLGLYQVWQTARQNQPEPSKS
jgi:SAM-dependent methyltransferase